MNWTKDRSIILSMVCVIAFAVALLALDAFSVFNCFVDIGIRAWSALLSRPKLFLGAVLSCSAFAWPALWLLWRLLGNLRGGTVFDPDNVSIMRKVSWCCAGVALASFVCGLGYGLLFIVTAAAAFMMLIVRIVKNVFQQAIAMKDELDLTV
ncbi:MAG: DUF2975 domain-containing protein [Clostridia bacterium]|nr:DUF2975 domain-containing protein [Clostridia bacterium]